MSNRKMQEAIARLQRARNVLAGLDEEGNPAHPKQSDPDVISFASGNGMRRPHPSVIAAGVAALLDTEVVSVERYFFGRKFEAFDNMVTGLFMSSGIKEKMAKQIVTANGTVKLFNAFLNSTSQPGDRFLVGSGYYHSLAGWADLNGVELTIIQTKVENEYKLVKSDLETWYEEQKEQLESGAINFPRGVILFNPTYTGAVYNYEELSDLANFILARDLVVLEDSIFMNTIFDTSIEKVHLAQFEQVGERVVTVNGGSKAYHLANMRIGWGCGAQSIISKMNQYVGVTQGTVPHIAKVMAMAAVQAPEAYHIGNQEECRKRVELIVDLIDQANQRLVKILGAPLGTRYLEVEHVPKAGHSILLSFSSLQGMVTPNGMMIHDSIDLTRYFLSEAKVCYSPGHSIGYSDLKLRISHGCVGLKETYQDVKEAELAHVLMEVMKRTNDDTSLQEVAATLQQEQSYHKWDHLDRQNSGFEMGRELIRAGILDRTVPAIATLVQYNRIVKENR